MSADRKDVKLIVKISNKEPIELMDLTKSLLSLASQFSSFASKKGTSKEEREAKLYVKELKSGSVIVELIEIATVGMLPFIENFNTIIEFTQYCQSVFSSLLNGGKPDIYRVLKFHECFEIETQ